MTITIDTENPRSVKAIEIAANAGQWAKIRSKDGRKAYGIPSSCEPGRLYLVTCSSCDCQDAARHPGQACKHVLAVRLHCALVKASAPKAKQAKPAAAAVPAGRPVLTMVRHGDGDFTWERSSDVARAARYDQIFGKDEAF